MSFTKKVYQRSIDFVPPYWNRYSSTGRNIRIRNLKAKIISDKTKESAIAQRICAEKIN
jgi:hypothetical protein